MSLLAASSNVSTLLLDMNGTFMFGHDRFGNDEDFLPAYARHGGAQLTADALNDAVRRAVRRLNGLYDDGREDARFPSVGAVVDEVLGHLDSTQRALVEQVIADHELGVVSSDDLRVLKALSNRFRLVVVSNLWSDSTRWRAYLSALSERLFSGFVFSSDIGVNKPAPRIFERALALANARASDVVMVGDDLRRDILPAAALGMRTAWVTGTAPPTALSDYRVGRLSELL